MNPKDSVGAKKAPTRYVPQALVLEVAPVMANGADKYGPFNWREQPVSAVTYGEAMQRHLSAWLEGQTYDECSLHPGLYGKEHPFDKATCDGSGLPHVAHIGASCGILLDAEANGTLLDDRVAGPAAAILRRLDKSAKPAAPTLVEVDPEFNPGYVMGPDDDAPYKPTTRFMCGHAFGEEPTEGCDPTAHWSRVNGVELVPSFEFRPVGPEAVPAIVAVCEDSGNHIPGRHLLECPDFS